MADLIQQQPLGGLGVDGTGVPGGGSGGGGGGSTGPGGTSASPMPPAPRLFQLEPIDAVPGWQQELADSFQTLTALVGGRSQLEAHDVLQQKASGSMQGHGELVDGLVYGVLTEPSDGAAYFRQLSIVSRDGFAHAVGRLQLVAAAPKFGQLRGDVVRQLFWVVGELARMNAGGAEQLVMHLTRQMRGGDVSPFNVKVCRQVLSLLETHYAWLMGHPALIATAAYAFARVALDHGRLGDLQALECAFVARLVRERFAECAAVGRDLVRVLQDIAKVAAISELWRDLLGGARLAGSVAQLLRVPTPRVFLANRMSFDMETRLLFILEHVPVTAYGRNLTWFVSQFLATPESETLFADVVRYVCGVCHPSNAVLASNIVPRYVFLGGLFRYVRSQVVAANAKLALFYDWLFFDPRADSIMNIEPGVLILARSVDKYTYLTASFVEFLAFVADAYHPPLAADIRAAIAAAMRDAVEKGVISSLVPVLEHPKIDAATRRHMHAMFASLLPAQPDSEPEPETELEPESDSESFNNVEDGAGNDTGMALSHLDAASQQRQRQGERQSFAADDDVPSSALLPSPAAPRIHAPVPIQPTLPPAGTRLPGLAIAASSSVDLHLMDPVSRMFHDDQQLPADHLAQSNARPYAAHTEHVVVEPTKSTEVDIDDEPSEEDTPLIVDASQDANELALPSTDDALRDPTLWLFGSALSEYVAQVTDIAQAAASGETESVCLRIKKLAEPIKEAIAMFAQSEASVESVAAILATAFASLDLEDAETNAELVACGEGDSVEHDALYYMLVSIATYVPDQGAEGLPSAASASASPACRSLDLLVRLTQYRSEVGFRWLLYSVVDLHRPELYRLYVSRYVGGGSLQAALSRDLSKLADTFQSLFFSTLPTIFSAFPQTIPGTKSIVRAVLGKCDQPRVLHLSTLLLQGRLRLFGSRAASIIGETMDVADSFEQVCLWQLLAVEIQGDMSLILRLVRGLLLKWNLDIEENSEVANGLLAVLRTAYPTKEILDIFLQYSTVDIAANADTGASENWIGDGTNPDVGINADADDCASSAAKDCSRIDYFCSVLSLWLRSHKELLFGILPYLHSSANGIRVLSWWKKNFVACQSPALCSDIDVACAGTRPVAVAMAAATAAVSQAAPVYLALPKSPEIDPAALDAVESADSFIYGDSCDENKTYDPNLSERDSKSDNDAAMLFESSAIIHDSKDSLEASETTSDTQTEKEKGSFNTLRKRRRSTSASNNLSVSGADNKNGVDAAGPGNSRRLRSNSQLSSDPSTTALPYTRKRVTRQTSKRPRRAIIASEDEEDEEDGNDGDCGNAGSSGSSSSGGDGDNVVGDSTFDKNEGDRDISSAKNRTRHSKRLDATTKEYLSESSLSSASSPLVSSDSEGDDINPNDDDF
ncbi:hypothetical protein GGI07_004138 [Coemansia sp. Benny D115]|nr:hypothetical protein GGI07_004138 [Coemansia sp. Benny D115]